MNEAELTETAKTRIRPMSIEDLERILQLEESSFPDPWTRNNFSHEVVTNEFSNACVIEVDGELAGYAVYWCFDIEAHLANFAIDSRYRRQNVGSILLKHVIEDIRNKNIGNIYLEVRASNVAARKLYAKHGFVEDGVRKNYYLKEKDDAVLMSLSLKEENDGLV